MAQQEKPLVYIKCIAYNHAPYIRDCIEGFLKQKTTFPFLIIIHDDASTDGTDEIIREYAEKYPSLIKPILSKENKYSQGILDDFLFQQCKDAKYVAECEGDDYWTDPLKLQKQVDILEADETLMACCTNVSLVDNHSKIIANERPTEVVPGNRTGRYNLRDFFRDNHVYPTLTVVYRNVHQNEIRSKWAHTQNSFLGDWTLWICMLIYGDMYYLNEVTGAYRINPTSVTHTVNRVARAKANREICRKVADILPDEYADIAADLRDTRWVWISLIRAYKAEKRYIAMFGAVLMALIMCPGSLWTSYKNRKKKE